MSTEPHILIVEDSDDDLELLLRDMKRAGMQPTYHRVDTADGVREALGRERFDIVLSDYNLPQHDFSDIRKAVSECDPDLPIIVVSGSIGEENAVALMREGVGDFILKGSTSRLIPAIRREIAAAEQHLARRESDRRFRDIVEVSGDWIWETDSAHRYTFFSNKFSDSEWPDPAACLGRTSWEVAGADLDTDEHWRAHVADLEARREFRSFLVPFVAPSGSRHHVSMSGLPVFDRNGKFRGYRGAATDETPIVEAFWRAEEAESLLRDAVESISEGFVIFDSDDRIVTVNEAYRKLFPEVVDLLVPGTRYEDLLRAAVQRSVYPEAANREEEWLEATRDDHRDLSGNNVYRLSGGRWALVTERRMSNGGIAGLTMDITALKTAEAELDHLTSHDGLTGLPNQALFAELLAQALDRIGRSGGALATVCLELSSLTDIRDTHGIETGDAAIREVARRLLDMTATGEAVAHLGGGQFLLLLTGMKSDSDALDIVERILPRFERSFPGSRAEIPLRVAFGVSTAPGDTREPDAIIRNASTAMHRAKNTPARPYQFYSSEMTKAAVLRSGLESDLRRAVENDELFLVYQPQVEAQSFDLVGAEALARWRHPVRGLIAPCDFIPIAEQTGLIVPIGQQLLRLACRQVQAWHDKGQRPPPISVNLSAVQLSDPKLEDSIVSILEETGAPPTAIKLELTESAILNDARTAMSTMRRLSSRGISFALDDFGIEHSALSHLSELPIDTLKIDRSFLVKMTADRGHAALYQAIVAMAHSLGMTAVAEGIELPGQLTYLQAHGCDVLQGFLFSPPVTAEAFVPMLDAGRVLPRSGSAEVAAA